MIWTYIIIAAILVVAELVYFKIADKCNIIDKPNERSSHTKVVLRGGGIIFTIGLWIWSIWQLVQVVQGVQDVQFYPWLLAGVTLAAGISFVDDIHSLPDSVRLVVQFIAMFLVFQEMGLLSVESLGLSVEGQFLSVVLLGLIVLAALIVAVGGTNIFNFMDGINGITAGYSLAMLIPLLLVSGFTFQDSSISRIGELENNTAGFVEPSYLIVAIIGVLVFSLFNFRPRGKAKCFAGDVGSIGMALILVFAVGRLMLVTGDVSWIVLFLVYGVDGVLTICHRVMLHENLGQAHRKHAYQLMANELKMSHVTVSCIYMMIQLIISLGFIYLCPNTILAHWVYT